MCAAVIGAARWIITELAMWGVCWNVLSEQLLLLLLWDFFSMFTKEVLSAEFFESDAVFNELFLLGFIIGQGREIVALKPFLNN